MAPARGRRSVQTRPLSGGRRARTDALLRVCHWRGHRLQHPPREQLHLFHWYGARSPEILARLVISKHSEENLEPKVIYQIWVVGFSSESYIIRPLTIFLCFLFLMEELP